MTDAEEHLHDQRRVVASRIASLTAQHAAILEGSRLTTDDDEHDPEGSTIAFERATVASLLKDAQQELRELDAADLRVSAGTYGICEVCGEPIADARLEALPTARTCIAHASARRR
ncbi:DnaK suppressor protein [Rhodococcoides trifolii]|uniref:DnaK suppressor protein n=1 Tax=Rhodococcoides trifolii TaxID=908250 RepID=A0A917LDG5_9NOCA|nr:TraR/DksA C4-type zinc finger protein [Rhodococcus trifolii]GGG14023.1 DnaK suppressor protein [Rhodococcus trifolii]